MDTQKLHDLIDKVIGKTGPLRTPAWWMRKVLNSLIEVFETDRKKLHKDIISVIASLDKSKIAKATYGTYDELYKLKENNKLVIGQMYVLTDYECTVSMFNNLANYFSSNNHVTGREVYILLTPISDHEFSHKATMFNLYSSYREEVLITFHFDTCYDLFDWALGSVEASSLSLLDSSGNVLDLTRTYTGLYEVRYQDKDGVVYKLEYNRNVNEKPLRKGDTVNVCSVEDNTYTSYTISNITGQYKGLISEAYIPSRNIKTAFDPYMKSGNFTLTLPDGSTASANFKESINPHSTNISIGCRHTNDGTISLCRFFIQYGSDYSLCIEDDCDFVYLPYRFQPMHIKRGCSLISFTGGNLDLTNSKKTLTIAAGSKNIAITTVIKNLCMLGPLTNCIIKGGATVYTNAALIVKGGEGTIIFPLGRSEYDPLFDVTRITTKGVEFISVDSNGNIRQWNPADYVDAIDEPVTTEEE